MRLQVSGLLGVKVILLINGQQRVLTAGDTTPEGVKVISIDDNGAMLEVDGIQEYYALGDSRISTAFTKPETVEERVYKDTFGMYRTVGSINGFPVSFLMDTGASAVAMNRNEAKRLGIDYLKRGEAAAAHTASGVIRAWRVRLDNVAVGQIRMRNVEALVIDGDSPPEILLGMSFLGRLNIQHKNEVMVLETKF